MLDDVDEIDDGGSKGREDGGEKAALEAEETGWKLMIKRWHQLGS